MEFSNQLAGKGLNLILVARQEDRLSTLAVNLKKEHSIETRVVPADLSKEDFLPGIKNTISDLEVGILINNAGCANTGPLVENTLDDELKLLHVNCRASLILSHEFGGQMKERQRGGMIFLASTVAFAAVSSWTNYCASKAYDLMLAEGLAVELKKYGVDVLAL